MTQQARQESSPRGSQLSVKDVGRTVRSFYRACAQMTSNPVPDSPAPFGYKICWLAVLSTDGAAIAEAVGLVEPQRSTWAQGVQAAYDGAVFVAPPVGGWTLVVGDAVVPGVEHADGPWRAMLVALSKRFGVVQFFATHRVVELHARACARDGVVKRAYGYVGESGETLFDDGVQTPEEVGLGFRFFDDNSPEAEDDAYWEREDLSYPDEKSVMALARRWSISPVDLSASSAEPMLGLVGPMRSFGKVRPSEDASRQARKPWWRFW